jgi:hypothetical protein
MTQWQALLFSMGIEVPVVYLLVTRKNWLRLPYWPDFLVTSLVATLLTHPLLWHAYLFRVRLFSINVLYVTTY